MNDKTWLILKLLLISAALSVAIKYLAPSLHIPATSTNALIAILLPSLVMAILLLWRGQQRPLRYLRSSSLSEKDIN
jgi:hypothetical protein